MSNRVKSEANNNQTTCQVNPICPNYDLPPVPSYDPQRIADQSSHNRTNVAASSPHDITGQQPFVQRSSSEDAEGMGRTNHISNNLHSNRNNEEIGDTLRDEEENVEEMEEEIADNFQENGVNRATFPRLDMVNTNNQMQDENRNDEEGEDTQGDEEENVDDKEEGVADKSQNNVEHQGSYPKLDMFATKDQIVEEAEEIPEDDSDTFWHEDDVDVRVNRTGTSERSENRPNHLTYICSDDHCTTYNPIEDSRIGMPKVGIIPKRVFVAAKDEKRKERNQDCVISAIGKYEHMQMPTERQVEEPDHVSSAIGKYEHMQMPTKRQVEEPDNLDLLNFLVGYKTTIDEAVKETLKADEIPEDASDTFWHEDDVDVRVNRTGTSERSENRPDHLTCICYDDHCTTYNPIEDKRLNNIVFVLAKDEKMKEINEDIMGFKSTIETSHADKGFRLAAGDTLGDAVQNVENVEEKVAVNLKDNGKNLVTSQTFDMFTNINPIQDEDSLAPFKVLIDMTTTSDKTGEEPIDWGRDAARLMHEQMLSMFSNDWINILPGEVRNKFINRSKSIHPEDSLAHFKLLADITATSERTGEQPLEGNLDLYSFPHEYVTRHYNVENKLLETLLSTCIGRINSVFTKEPDLSIRPYEKLFFFHQQRVKGDLQSQVDNHQTEHMAHLVELVYNLARLMSSYAPITDRSSHNRSNISASSPYDRTGQQSSAQIPVTEYAESMERTNQISNYQHYNRNNEGKEDTLGDKGENEKVDKEEVADNFQENDENPATSEQLDTFTTKNPMLVEDNSAYFRLWGDITTTPKNIGEEPSAVNNAAADKRCNHKLRIIKLYSNVIGNKTERMMNSIDMVVSEAEHLFGVERTQIFFDLLNYNLFHFGSAGAISTFVPNMAESDVRQHIMSFFEHACDTMNRLMRLLLSCTDSTNLQQMPEQDFTSLMKSVIDSSLQTNFKGGERISSEGSTLIMVDSEEFQRALGVKIPEDVLDRVGRGEEMVAHMFLDTKLVRNESRPILSLFFPSDCRLFISIPTESESYWHVLDVQRANRISQQEIVQTPLAIATHGHQV